jgi:acyl-[acyl carrier protein]--UDP-N-acetylglucosamine O-acyltransferase
MISDSATIHPSAIIMPGAFVGNFVKVGAHTVIHPNVTIYDHVEIGARVVIHAGTVVGSDAFYFNTKKNRDVWYKKMQSCGRVLIEDDVEIGASCTIDRGVTHDTVIGAGTKFDNQVHIGHDSVIGKNCLFAAQVGVAGAVEIKDGVVLWGQVGVSKTLTIEENTVVYAQSGVPKSLPANKVYFGSPVEEAADKMKELVWVKRIPALWDRMAAIEWKMVPTSMASPGATRCPEPLFTSRNDTMVSGRNRGLDEMLMLDSRMLRTPMLRLKHTWRPPVEPYITMWPSWPIESNSDCAVSSPMVMSPTSTPRPAVSASTRAAMSSNL